MKKIIESVMVAALLFGGGSLVEQQTAYAQASGTVGSLRGVIRDKATGEPAVGATVVATSPSLVGEQVVITEDGGQYFITALPPGNYILTVYYNDSTFSRGNVLIQVGKEVVVNVTVDSAASAGKPKGEVIEISGSAPVVDQGSTKTGLTVTDDYTRNIPTGRTFGAVLGASAGAQADNFGYSFAGAGSLENVYIVEGINTTDTAKGFLSSNLPNEFISETEVITGGYNAEFGRATGGIVNVVTKQGSNEFKGSVFSYIQPGALISDAKTIERQGSAIANETNLDYRYDIGAEVGGPIIKDKLWFHVGFNPSFTHYTTDRIVQSQRDTDMDGIPDRDPGTGFTQFEEVSRREIPRDFKTYYFTGKINGAVNQNNQFQLSFFGNPRSAEDVYTITRNPAQTQWKYTDGAYDIAGKWTSKFNGGKTQVDVVGGYHRGFLTNDPFTEAQNVPTVFYNFTRSLYDFADLEGESTIAKCQDGGMNDPYPMIRNCPVLQYTQQGLSLLENQITDRWSASAAVTHRVKLGPTGYHVFKAGGDIELAGYDQNNRYSGGAIWRRSANPASGAPGIWQLREYYKFIRNLTPEEQMDPDSVVLGMNQSLCSNNAALCGRADELRADTSNTNIGAYIQDQWQVRPNLTVNLGLRYEKQVVGAAEQLAGSTTPEGEIFPETAFTLDTFAPRLGFIYDPTKEGKAKLFGHYGHFYENVPMDLNVRAYGAEITNFTAVNATRKTPTQGGYDPNCDVDHIPGQTGNDIITKLEQCQDRVQQAILGGGLEFVSPGLKAQRSDEIVLGAEYEFAPDFKIGATWQHRELPTVIEDISVDGGNNYLITNPGDNLDSEADKLMAEAMRLQASSNPQEQALGALYESRANQMYYVKELEKPVRNYDAIQLQMTQRPSQKSLLQASYTYSKSRGNYPGLFSTETGQDDPNITSLYDLPDLMANRYGKLGHDRPHNLKVDGFYLFDFKKAGVLTTGASFRAQSGIAHNVLGAGVHPGYGNGEAYLLNRGAAPRSPTTTNFDVHLAYGYQINKKVKLEGFVNIFNLFNSQEELNQDENYTFDFVNPILGGDMEDLKHLKTLDGLSGTEQNVPPETNKNFGRTGTNNANIVGPQQAPRAVQLGFRLTF